jgi:hypothetical protein
MVNHHGFDRGRKICQDLMMITQPLAKKMSMGKARLMIVMPSSEGEKLCQKMQLCDELDLWLRRCKAASQAIDSPLEFWGKEIRYKGRLSKERI